MAARRQSNYQDDIGTEYIYGNTVRKPQRIEEPEWYPEPQEIEEPKREKRVRQKQKKVVSKKVRENRRKAMQVGPRYTVFLGISAMLLFAACVSYVWVREEVAKDSDRIHKLQRELASLKEENTTKYNAIVDAIDIEYVRDKALGEMGMTYATEEQIVIYKSETAGQITKYQGIPENGVAVQPDEVQPDEIVK